MKVTQVATGQRLEVKIKLVEPTDLSKYNQKRYFFDWSTECDFEVYGLSLSNSDDLLGLISIEDIPEECRIHIRLLTVSFENKGKNKAFDHVAGNLIAFVAKLALRKNGHYACVLLRPKSAIAKHYITKYKMRVTGLSMSLEIPELTDLIKEYDDGK